MPQAACGGLFHAAVRPAAEIALALPLFGASKL